MSAHRPVVAAIPHYNMPQTLEPLLGQVIKQGYDAVYVLDDHSTNCDIAKIVEPFGKAVTLIAGEQNRGAGGNRNRILEVDPKKLSGSILHFIDADCELLTKNIPDIARNLLSDHKIGAIGGLIYNPNGTQLEFNYFPRISLSGGLSGALMMAAIASGHTNPQKGKQLPKPLQRLLSDYPNPHKPPVAKNVFAVAEGNMIIPYDTLASVNGFDASLRFAEAQDLGYKLAAKKLTTRFDPAIAVKHHAILLSDRKRGRAMWHGYLRLVRKHGIPFK